MAWSWVSAQSPPDPARLTCAGEGPHCCAQLPGPAGCCLHPGQAQAKRLGVDQCHSAGCQWRRAAAGSSRAARPARSLGVPSEGAAPAAAAAPGAGCAAGSGTAAPPASPTALLRLRLAAPPHALVALACALCTRPPLMPLDLHGSTRLLKQGCTALS